MICMLFKWLDGNQVGKSERGFETDQVVHKLNSDFRSQFDIANLTLAMAYKGWQYNFKAFVPREIVTPRRRIRETDEQRPKHG